MPWLDAGPADLAPLAMRRVPLAGQRLLLCRAESGVYCVDEMCTHEDYSLAFGCVRDDRIKCSLHGSWFDLKSGQAECEPADCPLKTWPVRERDGRYEVLLEE